MNPEAQFIPTDASAKKFGRSSIAAISLSALSIRALLSFRGLHNAHDPPLGMPPSRRGLGGFHSHIVGVGGDENLAYASG
jgi:hypothetical protein